MIFFIFLGAPRLGIVVPTFWALTLGITLNNSAVLSEIFRAGIVSLPRGQGEAAAAIGLRKTQTFRIVLIPQAVRIYLGDQYAIPVYTLIAVIYLRVNTTLFRLARRIDHRPAR